MALEEMTNTRRTWAYDRSAAVAAGSNVTVLSFVHSGLAGPYRLRMRLGVSDVAQWANGIYFELHIAGRKRLTVSDEIADLKRDAVLPVDLTGKEAVEIKFFNQSAVPLDAAASLEVVSDYGDI